MNKGFFLNGIFLIGLAASATAQTNEAGIDKSRFTLLNPTPREAMREMVTDRPDLTESPYTVDAGHFQIETDIFSYSLDRYNTARADERAEVWSYGVVNLKVGLCNKADFQLVIPTYNVVRVRDHSTGLTQRQSGFGDMVARLKVNLWGNDGGKTALGLMPFVKLPTSQDNLGNDAYEGGLIIPFAISLPGDFGLGMMTEIDIFKDSSSSSYHPEVLNSVTLGHDIYGKLAGYVELTSLSSWESGSEWASTFNIGFTYRVTDNLMVDAGINLGLTRSADDYAPFVGFSWRY